MANEHDSTVDLTPQADLAEHVKDVEQVKVSERIETAERVAEEADAASEGALAALSAFTSQIQEARRVLHRRAMTPAEALLGARNGVRVDGHR